MKYVKMYVLEFDEKLGPIIADWWYKIKEYLYVYMLDLTYLKKKLLGLTNVWSRGIAFNVT